MAFWLVASYVGHVQYISFKFYPRGVVTYDLAKASCMNEEVRRKSIGSGSFAKSYLLVVESMGRNYSRDSKKKDGKSKL